MGLQIDWEPASFIRRSVAFVIDAAVVGFVWFGSAVAAGIPGNRPEEGFDEPWDTIVEIIIVALPVYWFVYRWISNGIGVSIGKKLLSLSIEPTISGRSSGIVSGLIRTVGEFISAVPLGLGYLWPLWDPENRAWHDKLAGTRVVRWHVESGQRPSPAKDLRFVCELSSPAAGVRYVELRREGFRLEDDHGARGIAYADIERTKVLPSGDVEVRYRGRDMFGRPGEQTIRLAVRDCETFLKELESRVGAATGAQLQVARADA